MNKLGEFIIVVIIFLLNPFLGFILSIYEAINKKENKKYLIMIALYYGFFGLIFLSKNDYDIRVHYQIFLDIIKYSNTEFFIFLSKEKDWLIFIFYRILGYFTKNPRWIGFFAAALSYGIPFYIIMNYGKLKKLKKIEVLLFILLFLGIVPSYSFSGMRNFTAICLFSLGIYLIEVLKLKKGYILVLVAPIMHISILILSGVYIFSRFIKITKLKIIISMLLTLILIIFSKFFLLVSLNYISEYSKFIAPYITGKSAIEVTVGWVQLLISYTFFYTILILFYADSLKNKGKLELDFYKFLMCYLPIISIFSFSKTMYERYTSNIKIIMILILVQIYLKISKGKKIIFIIIFLYSSLSYLALAKIEWETWNFKLITNSVMQNFVEKDNLNQKKYLELIREE